MPAKYGSISIYLKRGTTIVETLATCMYPQTSGSNTLEVNRTAVVDAGVYSIEVNSFSSDGGNMARNTSPIVMSYTFLDNSRMNAFIGDNGFVLRGNFENYFHLSFLGSQMSLKAKGNFDVPGVLAKARVASNGMIAKQWGKSISQVTNTTVGGANKRVYHNIGNDKYSAFCNGYGGADNPKVINETATYVDVYANGSFNIMLIGDNK